LVKGLRDGKALTRDELRSVLRKAGIAVDGELRMGYLMMRTELDGVVCSGPRHGKQFTYALLEERVPQGKTLDRGDALVELARRYFVSRGPASVQDFAKWSGLTLAEARSGLDAVQGQLHHEVVDRQTHWFPRPSPYAADSFSSAYLLSIYD